MASPVDIQGWRDITDDIVRAGKVRKLRSDIEKLRRRRGSIRATELVALALKLGRVESNRGKEPTYIVNGAFPLSIPKHPGTLAIGTACNILNALEADLERHESNLEQDEDETEQQDEGDDND